MTGDGQMPRVFEVFSTRNGKKWTGLLSPRQTKRYVITLAKLQSFGPTRWNLLLLASILGIDRCLTDRYFATA
jgi:hypothetical protein